MKKHRGFSLSTRYVVVVGLLLFAANVILGLVMMRQAEAAMKTMIQKNMLDLSNTAAGLLDGDMLGSFTEEDVGTPAYDDQLSHLSVFQAKADIEFIYAVRQVGEDAYVFIMDADPVDPGQFGEEVLVTDALIEAGKGVATADDSPAEDRWGNFYSTFSPVFDSEGKVAGVVGIDFSSEWYERELHKHTFSVSIVSIVSVLVGAFVMVLITRKLRQKFKALEKDISALAKNVDQLTEEITANQGYKESVGNMSAASPTAAPASVDDNPDDELESLGEKLRAMQLELERYLEYMHGQAYTDSLTRVGNTNAYQEEIRSLNEQIKDGSADFGIAVFDIDNLKIVNDLHGHACGDQIIRGAAQIISGTFGKEHTFRIGGDEFIAILRGMKLEEIEVRRPTIRDAVTAFNADPAHPEAQLSLSMGCAAYRPGDQLFREVFVRADEAMYENKDVHHRRTPTLKAQ